MKLFARFLLTVPFVVVAFGYYNFADPDENCQGLADLIIDVVFYIFLLLTGILAFVGTLRKRQSEKLKAEPITFSITLFTVLFLLYNSTLRGHTNGDKWIYSQSKNSNDLYSSQTLTLRKNGNFTVDLNDVDFGCSLSGSYKKTGDTIFLDKKTIDRTDSRMTTIYLIKSTEIVPLFDTMNKRTFTISERK